MSQNNSEETKQKLLFAAKIEFLEKGFKKRPCVIFAKKLVLRQERFISFLKIKKICFPL